MTAGSVMVLWAALVGGLLAPTAAQAAPDGVPVPPALGGQVVAWGNNIFGQSSVPVGLRGRNVVAIDGALESSLALTSDGELVTFGRGPNGGDPTPPASLRGKDVTAISTGAYHAMALKTDGTVTAWGDDRFGQASVPSSLTGVTVTAIAAGGNHSLVLTSDGKVVAWGWNPDGQADVPTSLDGQRVTAIAAGVDGSMALTDDGRVTTWGALPEAPSSLDGKTVTAIAAGQSHAVALTSDGKVTAWGSNYDGQSDVPAALDSKTVTAVVAGYYYSAALTDDGQIVAWGRDDRTVVPALDGRRVTAIAGGSHHLLALTAALHADAAPVVAGVPQVGGQLTAVPGRYNADPNELVYAWKANGSAVGTDSAIYRPTAADVDKALTVTVTARRPGYADTVTTSTATSKVVAGGRVTAWGSNFAQESVVPGALSRREVIAVAAGFNHSVALTGTGRVVAWGAGSQGAVPDALLNRTVVAVAAGANHSLALTGDGQVVGWGNNANGQVTVPASLASLTVVAVAAGASHSLALTGDGQVVAWGNNANGQSTVPSSLSGRRVVAISAGSNHSLAVTADGRVTAWGSNTAGQSDVPAALEGETVMSVAGGTRHSVALTARGRVVTWGDNAFGQTTVPAALSGTDVVAVASGAGADVSLALTSDRQIVAWGSNANGQRIVPASLSGTPNAAIAAAGSHALALTTAVVADAAVVVEGVARIGSTLTARPGAVNVTGARHAFQWSADGEQIPGATGTTYTPTADRLGTTVTVTHTVSKAGYVSSAETSTGAGPVVKGSFTTGPTAGITGSPVVGSTLVASTGTTVPTAGSFSFTWAADGVAIDGATGDRLTLTPAEVGKGITVEVTASADGYVDASDESGPTSPVGKAQFTTGPRAGIDGTARVGDTLGVTVAAAVPAADSYAYSWSADGTSIDGATDDQLVLTPGLVGAKITVTVTASREGFDDVSDVSAATGEVALGVFATGPTAGIAGTPVVGGTLTATTGTTSPAATSYSYEWSADGALIEGAKDDELVLTPDLVGKVIAVTVTASRNGYVDAVDESGATEPVAKAMFATGPTAGITGTPVVDGTLSATTGTTLPAATSYAYVWSADGVPLEGAVDDELVLTPAVAGRKISVTVTAAADGFVDASDESDPTAAVARATFAVGPDAVVSGTAQVGQTLTVAPGPDQTSATTPSADSFTYAWAADGAPIEGAATADLVLTPAMARATITATVTAVRAGYEDAIDVSDPVGPVSTVGPDAAPKVKLAASRSSLRRGQASVLTWSTEGATAVTARVVPGASDRSWTGPLAAAGARRVEPVAAGVTTYEVTATNARGTTTARVAVVVRRPAATLRVRVSGGRPVATTRRGVDARLHPVGRRVTVRADGLERGERYTVRIGRRTVATGLNGSTTLTPRSRRLKVAVVLPRGLSDGRHRVRVTGSSSDRSGSVRVRTIAAKTLRMSLSDGRVRASDPQTVTVRGLAPGEPVVVTYKGRTISPRKARANASGRYRITFGVGTAWGTKTLGVTGALRSRTATAEFDVVTRCRGTWFCR